MIKLSVKSLLFGLFILGCNLVTVNAANAIPERYVFDGVVSGWEPGPGGLFFGRNFELTMDIDSDLLADPREFVAFLDVDGLGVIDWQYGGEGQGPFQFDVSRSVYTDQGGGFINKLVVNAYSQSAYGHLNLDVSLLPDGGVFDSDFSFNGAGFGNGQGTVDSVTRIALPTPSAAFLMIPALLLLFGRSFASKLKPVLVNKKKARFEMYPALSG